jgi:hypothetical protein
VVLQVGQGGEALFALDQPCGKGVGVRLHRSQPRGCGAAYHAPMPELAFLAAGGAAGDLAIALAQEVSRQDAVGVVCDEPLAEGADRVHVVVLDSAARCVDALPDLSRSIVVLLAPPPTDCFVEGMRLARGAGAVFHVNAAAVVDLLDRDLPARHLPLGYVAAWDRFDPGADPGVTILRSDHGYFDWLGALRPIQSGLVVLHERSRGMAPLVAGRHLFVGDADSLDTLAEILLRDPERLEEVRRQAIAFVRGALPLGRTAAALIGAARGVVGQPLSAT